jgi:hypothetical protein
MRVKSNPIVAEYDGALQIVSENWNGARCSRRVCEKAEPLISGKKVSFSFSEPYQFMACLRASERVSSSNSNTPRSGEKSQSSIECGLVDFLQTYFSPKSVLDAAGSHAERVSPHPSPQSGTPALAENLEKKGDS